MLRSDNKYFTKPYIHRKAKNMTEIMFSGTGVKVDKCNCISLKCPAGVFLKFILFRKQLMLVMKKVSEYDPEIP